MRCKKWVVLILLLIVAPSAFAACGDSTVDTGEQCDDGNTADGDGCSATCQLEDFPESLATLKLLVGHNLLFSKVMDLLHIIKDQIYQLEFKILEIHMIDNTDCTGFPPSFALRASQYPYGKLDELDEMVQMLVNSWSEFSSGALTTAFGSDAATRLSTANSTLSLARSKKTTGNNTGALLCDCEAIQVLGGTRNTSDVTCS